MATSQLNNECLASDEQSSEEVISANWKCSKQGATFSSQQGLQQSTEESNWQCLPSNEESTDEITFYNQLCTGQGFVFTDGCLDSEPTHFDNEVLAISPLPPPYQIHQRGY